MSYRHDWVRLTSLHETVVKVMYDFLSYFLTLGSSGKGFAGRTGRPPFSGLIFEGFVADGVE